MRFVTDAFEWSDDSVLRLKTLWAEGHSTAEIGRRMGVSKNAIVGKAHRLNLPARPSPIRVGVERSPSRPRTAPGVTLPALFSRDTATKASAVIRPRPTPPPSQTGHPTKPGVSRCCWPIGDPGTPEFRFCEAANAAGYPYCPGHCAIAYRPTRSRPEAA
jgi:GcrA cell cycle regulator